MTITGEIKIHFERVPDVNNCKVMETLESFGFHQFVGTPTHDERISITEHVNRLVHSCFNQLRRIRFIRRSLMTTVATCLVNSFIVTRVDYCNSILAGLPKYQLSRIQSVLHLLRQFCSVNVLSRSEARVCGTTCRTMSRRLDPSSCLSRLKTLI